MLIIGQHVSQNTNDKQEVSPALAVLSCLSGGLGRIAKAAADSGYLSKDNTQQFEKTGIEPYMPNGRQHHNPTLEERFAKAPEAPKDPDSVEAMAHRMKTEAGKKILCPTQIYRRTRVWDYQRSHGLSSFYATWFRRSARRVGAGVYGVQSKTSLRLGFLNKGK